MQIGHLLRIGVLRVVEEESLVFAQTWLPWTLRHRLDALSNELNRATISPNIDSNSLCILYNILLSYLKVLECLLIHEHITLLGEPCESILVAQYGLSDLL